jgi:hypothetical protein
VVEFYPWHFFAFAVVAIASFYFLVLVTLEVLAPFIWPEQLPSIYRTLQLHHSVYDWYRTEQPLNSADSYTHEDLTHP